MKYCKVCGAECSGRLEIMITPKKMIGVCRHCFMLTEEEIKKRIKK